MSESADSAGLDEMWEDLAPHVEWPEGFSLVLLFAGHPGPVEELRERLEASMQQRDKTLARIDPAQDDDVRALIPRILAPPEPDCGARWISLLRGGGDPNWTAALRWLLQRLNERRLLLERDVRVPVVVVLPLELQSEFYVLAPDLWSVRGFAEVVPSSTLEKPSISAAPSMAHRRDVAGTPEPGLVRPQAPVEAEWARLLATGDLPRLSIWDGIAAQEAALERGDLRAARRIAVETLTVALSQAGVAVERLDDFDVTEALAEAKPHSAQAQRHLSVSLNKLGNVEMQAGNLATARFLFQRSHSIAEALAEAEPHSAQAQRDLAISLDNIGNVEVHAGNLASARSVFQRSSNILEALAKPHDAKAQRDLSISLERLGNVEAQAGNLDAARSFLQRSHHLREALAEAESHSSAQTKRDLSVSLNKLGNVEVQAGNLAAARSLLQRSLDLREVLALEEPHSAKAQRDLSISLERLGNVEVQAGNLATARSLFQRALDLREALAEADPHDAQARSDMVGSLRCLALVAERHADRATELDYLRRAHTILTAMDARGQIRDYAERQRLLDEVTRRLSEVTVPGP